ncbi:MAG: metal ABC transporter permease [Armatimonadota bacterium]
MEQWLSSPNLRWVLAGCMLLGVSSGVLGSFALLRRRSLISDALAHAALPGVCVAFLLTGQRSLALFLLGALAAGLIGAFCIQAITRYSRIKEDTALGLVLSVFFGFGIVLLTRIQQSGQSSQAGLDKFIFGQAASMVGVDVRIMAACAAVVCLLSLLFFKELKLLCFDPGFARGLGYSTLVLDGILLFLIVLAVVIGLQAVGAVLMAALLITPAAAARLWTDRLGVMVALSGVIGAVSGALGTIGSTFQSGMPTGPVIVLAATAAFVFSLIFAPRRGLLSRLLRLVSLRGRVAREHALRTAYELTEAAGDWERRFTAAEFAGHRGTSPVAAARALRRLEREGSLVRFGDGYAFSKQGREAAYSVVRNHRLWEMFLMHEGQLGADHVDRDADLIEHLLPRDTVEELERLLRVHGRALELPPSVHPVRS